MLNFRQKSKVKRFTIVILVILFSILLLPAFIFASNGYVSQNLSSLETGETLDGPGFFGGNIVKVDGNVEGTTFAAGQSVTINGNINGDLFVAAQTVTINGTVTGNIYGAGQEITFNGQNSSDAFLAGQNIVIEKDAVIGRDLIAASAVNTMNGTIKRDFSSGASDISIKGTVGRNVVLDGENITIQDKAIINGNFTYKSTLEANIVAGSQIGGHLDWQYVDRTPEKQIKTPVMTFGSVLLSIASGLLLWFVIRIWKPEIWNKTSEKISEQPLKTLGIGAIALIVTPILVILIMITVIGIPVGILLGIAYAISIYLSKIIVAVFIGSWLAKRFGWREIHKGVWLVLLGLVTVTLLGMVPVLKILIWLITLFAGLGAIVSINSKNRAGESIGETEMPQTGEIYKLSK